MASKNPCRRFGRLFNFLSPETIRVFAGTVTLLAANRNTVKLHLRQLVQQGYLEQHGTGKGTWYSVAK
jgi:DNA-binding IclR family transcriptional regulator